MYRAATSKRIVFSARNVNDSSNRSSRRVAAYNGNH
jgi:acyl-CoA thioesterase